MFLQKDMMANLVATRCRKTTERLESMAEAVVFLFIRHLIFDISANDFFLLYVEYCHCLCAGSTMLKECKISRTAQFHQDCSYMIMKHNKDE